MKLKLLFLCALSLNLATAATFTSRLAGPADMSAPGAWTVTSGTDADGIPDSDDYLDIQAGHTITITSTMTVYTVRVYGTLQFSSHGHLIIWGNYIVDGVETGTGAISFSLGPRTIRGSGTFGPSVRWTFSEPRDILSGTTIVKTGRTRINPGVVVTNNGTVTLGLMEIHSGAVWTQGLNSTLTLNHATFFTGIYAGTGTFNASAIGNTVNVNYVSGNVPVPTSTYYNLVIGGTSSTKALAANTTISNSFTITSGNTLNSNNFNLTLGGNWSNSGSFLATSNRSVTFSGTGGPQTLSGTGTTFENLVINNSAGVSIVSGTYVLNEVLTVTAGTFNTFGNSFTMSSTAAKTARIAPLGASATLSGNFRVQRFISARDTTYADLSSPVQNSTFQDWDNELIVSYASAPPYQYASAYTYDEALDDYVAVTSSAQALNPGQGFEVFLSGDASFNPYPNSVINTIGVPNQGTQNLSGRVSASASGYNLVGNPFASNIRWSDVYTASGAAASNLFDYYETYDYTTGGYTGFTSADGTEIAATQGFWVYADFTGAPSLIIPESAKTTTMVSDIRRSIVQPFFTLKMGYADKSIPFSHTFKAVATPDATDAFRLGEDFPFRKSPNKTTPSLYTMVDGKKVNINSFSLNNDYYAMAIRTETSVAGEYTLEAAGFDFVADYSCIKLEDKLLNKIIDLKAENGYTFRISEGDDANRFIVHFSKSGDCKSPIASAASNFSNEVEILPTENGNKINFDLSEATPSVITVTNVLGQNLAEVQRVVASDQAVEITLPSDYSGMYVVCVESAKGRITKKFVRK